MRTVIKGIYMGIVLSQVLLQFHMKSFDVSAGIESQGNATLVADNDDVAAGLVQGRNRRLCTMKKLKVAPGANELTFGEFAICDTIAIEKDVLDTWELCRLSVGNHQRYVS
jgi:hypothetical protein